jgi:hypothetical protein
MTIRIRLVCLAGTVAVASTGSVAAQQTRLTEEAIPRELATALMSIPRPVPAWDSPQIWIGSVPQNLSRRLFIPSNARVIGGAGAGASMIAVVSMPGSQATVRSDLRRELGKLGWTPPPPYGYGGGFRPLPPALDTTSFPTLFCQATETLMLAPGRQELDATTVTYQVISGNSGLCTPPTMGPGMPRSTYPTLYNPAGSDALFGSGACPFPNAGMVGQTSTRLRTGLSGDQILDHYAAQLRDSGWTAGSASTIATRTWSRPDSAGAPQELVLTVTGAGGSASCREMTMTIRRPPGR